MCASVPVCDVCICVCVRERKQRKLVGGRVRETVKMSVVFGFSRGGF
jgi:hypothetical protein